MNGGVGNKKVFISHSSADKPAVEKLARALRAAGIDAWLDKWEISSGDNVVARMNQGLEECDAGLVVFSSHSKESCWVNAEVSYLTYARIQEGKPLIPVSVDDAAYVPALLRPLARHAISDVETIVQAIHQRRSPPPLGQRVQSRVHRVRFAFERAGAVGLRLAVELDGRELATASWDALPADVVAGRKAFLEGVRAGLRRGPEPEERAALERDLAGLGRALRELCLPGDAGQALTELIDGGVGTTVELAFEADHPELLGLPFEALRLPDDRLLAVQAPVVMLRRPRGVKAPGHPALAGPLKLLVAVGAPDEGQATPGVLDQERELQSILDAVDEAQRRDNAEVRILEVGHPDVIGDAVAQDAYHVLHLSCRSMPGGLELEDEEGRAVQVTAGELLEPITRTGRPLPLVFLNARHGGASEQAGSFPEALLRAGVPMVLAMQTAVSDGYATGLAKAFYEHLARGEAPQASRALAQARKDMEKARLKAVRRGGALAETQPEFATATLYLAGEEQPLADFGLDKMRLLARPVHHLGGQVPQLKQDDLIGRRRELRETLRTLRGERGEHAGIVLVGIGGVGKSAIAGRAMRRLVEQRFLVAAHVGCWDMRGIATAVGTALLSADRDEQQKRGDMLVNRPLDEGVCLQLLAAILAEEPVVLVLDDFEQNLTKGGDAFLDPDVKVYLGRLLRSAGAGKLLLTSRYLVPGTELSLRHLSVGPLRDAESRKLFQRLPGLRERPREELDEVLRTIGGHPRMLEFLDGLLCGGKGRLPDVSKRLREKLTELRKDARGSLGNFEESVQRAVLVGARDVFLDELLEFVRGEGLEETLLQAAVSNLPVSLAGLAHMLAGAPADAAPVERALKRLEALSLVFRSEGGAAWVHRWTAEGLALRVPEAEHRERHRRAGRYRRWRVEHESHDIGDAIEAVRNHLAGRDFDEATSVAFACFEALRRTQESAGISALAGEVLETLPSIHINYAAVVDAEANAYRALGFTDQAIARCESLRQFHEERVKAEPDRADYQRDLSVSYERVGDLYRDLGQGEKAHAAFLQALAIREHLAKAEPDRADYQRDLSVSYERVGDLYRNLGRGEKAREVFPQALAIREHLAKGEPDRADYQRDLSVSYNKVGSLYRDLGQGEKARAAFLRALAICEHLAKAEPDRADYQRDLSVSCINVGDVYRDLGQGEEALKAFLQALAIAERLAKGESDRADYQHDLSVSYTKVGEAYGDLGQGEEARKAFLQALAIAERLAKGEPDRADYQRDLSVSYTNVGDLYRGLGQGEKAREVFLQALAIAERVAKAEPDRADYQRDLSISYNKVGDVYGDLGQGEKAREAFLQSLAIRERLAKAEPDRADYKRNLSVSYIKVGDLYRGLGEGEKAREAFLQALAIAERLAKDEPDRADYQVDLAISLQRVGSTLGLQGVEHLHRALALLRNLDAQDRLAPVHRPTIKFLENMIGTRRSL